MLRNTLKLDTSGMFTDLIARLEDIGGDVEQAISDGLHNASAKIAKDTEKALFAPSLPAHGKYSTGATEESIVRDAQVEWQGSVASIPVGFDFSKKGAGGFLISGTPTMQPDKALQKMYKGKQYMLEVSKEIEEAVGDHIVRRMME